MAGIGQFSGVASGIDWKTVLDRLREVENKKVVLIQNQEKTYQDKLTAWQAINTKLLSLKTAAKTLNQTDQFNLYKTSLSSDNTTNADEILSATASTEAAPGSYQIKVTSLARAQKLSSTSYASQSSALNLSGDISVGGRPISISANDTLVDIREKFNAVNTGNSPSGVTATIVNYGTSGYRLILTSDKEGLAGTGLSTGGILGLVEIQAGANASITVDGFTVNPSSNSVSDVISGVTFNLEKAAPDTTVTLSVARDYEGIKKKISDFVTAYNDTIDSINAQTTYNTVTKQPGDPLFGDGSLRTIKSNLTNIVLGRVSGVNASFSTLGLIGIKIGSDRKLTIDEDALKSNLESHFFDVQRLFAAGWSSTNSNLIYSYHTVDTKAGTYTINVTGTSPIAGYFMNEGDATGTGNGEFLTGISGDGKGLRVRYSGTATGPVGNLTLTYGVAELFDRSLYHITDAVDGTIANKEKTIQDAIKNLDKHIKNMQDRIDNKMHTMEGQFIRMESLLSTLQSQSNWLTNQLNAL